MPTKSIPIKDVCIDAGLQQRPVDDDTMRRYAALIKDGYKGFPPVNIVTDGNNNYLYDGFHRYFAHLRLGKKYIEASVEPGTRRNAIYFSFSANKTNAFPRQPGTVKGIVEKMLGDEEWAKMPIRGIADHSGCTERYVKKIQADLKNQGVNCSPPKPGSKPKNQLNRAKTRTVKRNGTEHEAKVPEKKTLDSTGKNLHEHHEHLVKYFERANEYRQMIKQLNDMLKTVRNGKNVCVECGSEFSEPIVRKDSDGREHECQGDLFYRYIKIENLTAEIGNVKRIFRFAVPYAVCGYCGGDVNNDQCRACGGAGFVNEITYKSTPDDLK